jgi:hypothetical protein
LSAACWPPRPRWERQQPLVSLEALVLALALDYYYYIWARAQKEAAPTHLRKKIQSENLQVQINPND